MPSWVAWLIAAVSTTAFLVLWFWEVRRVLRSRRSVVESAAAQLSACRRQAAGVRYDPELAQILARSESIYRQAVAHYNDTLCKPWCYLPGHLLGFDRDMLTLHVPSVEVRDVYSAAERRQFGMAQQTEVRVPVLKYSF